MWLDAHRRHVVEQGIPGLTSSDLNSLSPEQLEIRVLRIARFHQNWTSSRPQHRRSLEFDINCHHKPIHPASSSTSAVDNNANVNNLPQRFDNLDMDQVTQVFFPPGCNGELIITVIAPQPPANRNPYLNPNNPFRHRIVCWEVPLSSTEVFMFAERTLPDNWLIEGVTINDDAASDATLAVVFSHGDPNT